MQHQVALGGVLVGLRDFGNGWRHLPAFHARNDPARTDGLRSGRRALLHVGDENAVLDHASVDASYARAALLAVWFCAEILVDDAGNDREMRLADASDHLLQH